MDKLKEPIDLREDNPLITIEISIGLDLMDIDDPRHIQSWVNGESSYGFNDNFLELENMTALEYLTRMNNANLACIKRNKRLEKENA